MGRRQDERLRRMYPGGRGTTTARRYAAFWNLAVRSGLLPRRWVSLEVTGRRSGRVTRFPLGMADVGDRWYLVSMLGDCNWVKNVRATGGRATLRRARSRPVRLVEVPPQGRAPILRRYVQMVPGGRPHIPVNRGAPVADFAAVAADYPVFLVEFVEGRPTRERSMRERPTQERPTQERPTRERSADDGR